MNSLITLTCKSFIIFSLVCYSLSCYSQNWQKVELDPEFSQNIFSKIHFVDDNVGFIIGQNGTILKTTDGGFIWDEIQSGVTHYLLDISFANENVGYINGLKTTDGGTTWTVQSTTTDFSFMHAFNENHVIANYAFGGNDYQVSFDGGSTWNGVPIPTLPDMDLFAYRPNDYASIDEAIGYLSLNKGILESADTLRLLKTTNGGNSWTPIAVPASIPAPDLGFNGFNGIAFPSENIGLVLHDNGVLKTSDGGTTFTEIIPDSRPDFWSPVAIHAASADHYLLTGLKPFITDSVVSLYETLDGGLSWDEALVIPGDEYLADAFCTSINCFVVGEGLYRKFDVPSSTLEINKDDIKIFPNPSRDYLQIESNASRIEVVKVFDIYGREHKKYSFSPNRIDIADLPTGFYLLQIAFGGNERFLRFEKI